MVLYIHLIDHICYDTNPLGSDALGSWVEGEESAKVGD
jgi:hypothetical protein